MKKKLAALGILALALAGSAANAEAGFLEKMLPSSAIDTLRSLKDSLTPAEKDASVQFQTLGMPNRGGGQAPRQQPPRQQPPRQQPPRQQPPRQQPPRQEPPHRDPNPPHRDPNPPHRNPIPTPVPQPPHRDPHPPHRDPNPPHRNPIPTPVPQPPHRDPNPIPRPQPPRNRCPDPRNPLCPRNPRRPQQPPAGQHPPVVIHPGQPESGEHRMPHAPRPLPGGPIDPRHQGDGRTIHPPRDRDGRTVPQRPWHDRNGRIVPPDHDRIGRIDRDDMRRDIHGVQDRWNRNDHDYHWHDWNGMPVCHHYDEFGYHWWGFYVGDTYFWTRFYNDQYWWYDPYFHRWVFLRDGRWWWQDGGSIYVLIGHDYYRYGDGDGTVVVTPDPTAPVDVPPADPGAPAPAPDQTMFYSADGTRSVQIVGPAKDAYLYDLTVADPAGADAQGRWIGTGAASAKFAADEKMGPDGAPVEVLRQVELTFDDAAKSAVADVNGEREVVVSGEARNAVLYNLKDDSVEPTPLADNETGVILFNEDRAGADGIVRPTLSLVIVTARNEATGVDDTLTFDRDGAPYAAAPAAATGLRDVRAEEAGRRLEKNVQASPTLKALSDGFDWQ